MIKNVTFSNTSKYIFLVFTQCYLKHYFVSHQLMYSKVYPIYYTVKAFQVNIRHYLYIQNHTKHTIHLQVVFCFFHLPSWKVRCLLQREGVLDPVSQSQISSLKHDQKKNRCEQFVLNNTFALEETLYMTLYNKMW